MKIDSSLSTSYDGDGNPVETPVISRTADPERRSKPPVAGVYLQVINSLVNFGDYGFPAFTNGIIGIGVTNGGSGYTTAPAVSFTGGGGSGAAATAIISLGSVVGVKITDAGDGYTSVPTVVLTGGGGTLAHAVATIGCAHWYYNWSVSGTTHDGNGNPLTATGGFSVNLATGAQTGSASISNSIWDPPNLDPRPISSYIAAVWYVNPPAPTATVVNWIWGAGDGTAGATEYYTTVLDTEVTVAEVVAAAVANLPAWPTSWVTDLLDYNQFFVPAAYLNLSGYGASGVNLNQSKWRIQHEYSVTGYLKIWVNIIFIPSGSTLGAIDNVITVLDPYVWTAGSGLTDPTKPVNDPVNMIYSDPALVDATITGALGNYWVKIVKFSMLEAYDADVPDDGSANGFPA